MTKMEARQEDKKLPFDRNFIYKSKKWQRHLESHYLKVEKTLIYKLMAFHAMKKDKKQSVYT